VKETVHIEAMGRVVSKWMGKGTDGKERNHLEIQIEKLSISDVKESTKRAETKAFIDQRNKEKRGRV
jgi:uncharacterized protein YebE (UPF0316 family)